MSVQRSMRHLQAQQNVWDLSVCLDCHLRSLRRQRVRSRSLTTLSTAAASQHLDSFGLGIDAATRAQQNHDYSTTSRRTLSSHPLSLPRRKACSGIPGRRNLSSTSPAWSSMGTSWDSAPTVPRPMPFKIRKGANRPKDQEEQGRSNIVRDMLRNWQPPLDQQITPIFSEAEQRGGRQLGEEHVNDLTRPEDRSTIELEDDLLDDHDQIEDFSDDFDRLAAISGDSDAFVTNLQLAAGDMVRLRSRSASSLLGVFLGLNKDRQFVYYASNGALYVTDNRSPDYYVPKYFSAEDIAPLLPFVAGAMDTKAAPAGVLKKTDQVPRGAGAAVLRRFDAFRRETEAYYRKYAGAMDKAFETIAHPTEVTYRTLEDVVSIITGLPVPPEGQFAPALEFTISESLLFEKFGFNMEARTFGQNRILIIVAKNNIASLYRVQSWLRAYWDEAARVAGGQSIPPVVAQGANIVKNFMKKVQRISAESRQLRPSTERLDVLVSSKDSENIKEEKIIPTINWNDADRDFIRVMHLHTCGDLLYKINDFKNMSASMGRASNIFNELTEVGVHVGTSYTFLQEIGFLQPFTEPEPFDMDVRPANIALNMSLNKIGQRIMAGEPLLKAANLRDSMNEIRRDWGKLPVYCIDKASTQEIDDGISVESIPGEPGNYWMHVHVVHLSAFVSPTHPIGRCAEHRLTTLYNEAAGAMTMLPPWVGRDFSLGPNKPCMTFSAKLDSDGNLLEHKVQAGFIRNVVRLTPDGINKMLGKHLDIEATVLHKLQVGPDIAEEEKPDDTEAHVAMAKEREPTLQLMHDLMTKYMIKRNGIKYWQVNQQVDIKVQNVKTWPFGVSSPDTWKSEFWLVDPTITIRKLDQAEGHFEGEDLPAQRIVEQAMILAGHVAAKYCSERGIPFVYNGMRPSIKGLNDAEVTKGLRERIEAGKMNRIMYRQILNLYATGVRSSSPVPQPFIGLEEYGRVTSPLRRHFDLVNMWQIDAALLEEHRRSRTEHILDSNTTSSSASPPTTSNVDSSLIATASTNATASWLPYDLDAMNRLIRVCTSRTLTLNWYNSGNRQHWKIMALARAFYHKQAPIPTLHVEIGHLTRIATRRSRNIEFEINFEVHSGSDQARLNSGAMPLEGEIWEVEIMEVFVYTKGVWCRPVRRVAHSLAEFEAEQRREREEREARGGGEKVIVENEMRF